MQIKLNKNHLLILASFPSRVLFFGKKLTLVGVFLEGIPLTSQKNPCLLVLAILSSPLSLALASWKDWKGTA